jgi:hypothetical protein
MSDLRPQVGQSVFNQVAVAEAHNVLLTERGSQAIVTSRLFWSYPGVASQTAQQAERWSCSSSRCFSSNS